MEQMCIRDRVNICLKVLDELHLNIPVCGMVKDDNHRTRGLYYNNIEIPIDRGSEGDVYKRQLPNCSPLLPRLLYPLA